MVCAPAPPPIARESRPLFEGLSPTKPLFRPLFQRSLELLLTALRPGHVLRRILRASGRSRAPKAWPICRSPRQLKSAFAGNLQIAHLSRALAPSRVQSSRIRPGTARRRPLRRRRHHLHRHSIRSGFILHFCRQFLVCTCVLRSFTRGFLRICRVDTKGTVYKCGERTRARWKLAKSAGSGPLRIIREENIVQRKKTTPSKA